MEDTKSQDFKNQSIYKVRLNLEIEVALKFLLSDPEPTRNEVIEMCTSLMKKDSKDEEYLQENYLEEAVEETVKKCLKSQFAEEFLISVPLVTGQLLSDSTSGKVS